MRSRVNSLLFWGIFSSVTFQKYALDCGIMKSNKFPSPTLKAETTVVTKGQNVSLFCSHKNKSLEITYSLFLNKTLVGDKTGKVDRMVFHRIISEAKDLGPYKCKTSVFNCTKNGTYSQELKFTVMMKLPEDSCPLCLRLLLPGLLLLLSLAVVLMLLFWIRRKHKARKAERENALVDQETTPEETDIYVNVCKPPAGTGPSPEIHYATPNFHALETERQETYDYCTAEYIYLNIMTQRAGT
ncbi:allergin-1 [Oryctolagus cuniculus]|uniref:allergin-1 n=1 Tax=Oryctolagus cuniculus TaxID=9986 RepID=UPI0003904C55|nr:allergin-1 [Oryctolagus cuniculus]